MLFYLVKSTAILAILLLFYKLFLEMESIHKFKRHFLLVSILVATIIPAITFTTYIKVTPLPLPILDGHVNNVQLTEDPSIDYTASVLWIIYALGVLVFGIRFMYNIAQIFIRINRSEKLRKGSFIYVLLNNLKIPHTFFNYLFFDKNTYKAQSIPKEVELHEQTHATQLHSLDILLIELLQVVFWFNPIIYLLKHMVKLNHEFIADEAVLKSGVAIKNYQHILLNYSNIHKNYPIANAINYSLIKKRLIIMKTRTSKIRSQLFYFTMIPLTIMLIYGFSSKQTKYVLNNKTEVFSQNNFNISMKNVSDGVEMTCEGCAWRELTFSLSNNQIVAVNEYGMSYDLNKVYKSEKLDNALAEFMFHIQKDDENFILEGIIGTKWVNLKFDVPINNVKYINQKGIYHSPLVIEESSIEAPQNNSSVKISKDEYYKNVTFIYIDKTGKNKISKQYNELSTEEKSKLVPPPSVPLKKSPSQSLIDEWKDSKKYGVWLDNSRINNDLLNTIEPENISLYYVSRLAKNAKNYGKHYYQVDLYTNKKYNELYKNGIKPLGEKTSITITKSSVSRLDTIPPPPPPTPSLNAIEKGSEKLQDTYKKYSKSAEKYAESVRKYNGTEEGRSKLYDQYKEVMKLYDEFKALAEKENILATPPPPPPIPAKKSTSKKVGFIEKNGQTLFYNKTKDTIEYYNRYGMSVDKEGNPIKV
jgi:beta-lactamase regulating signal transducer with metallopeptidase domain